jgi:hypothetical protein
MNHRLVFTNLLLFALSLAVVPAALASTTWYVDGVNGSDSNNCTTPTTACKTIGHAISLASSSDSIMIAPATYTENLSININLNLIGSGARTTIIDGGGVNQVISIGVQRVVLSKLSIVNGLNTGILTSGTLTINNSIISNNGYRFSYGGGIYNFGTLTINHSTIRGNHAVFGGGIYSYSGKVTINNSTISGNFATAGTFDSRAGGIEDDGVGTMTINNSTISGNRTLGEGGGIWNYQDTITVNNSTISGNGASDGGGILALLGSTTTFQNSIVADSPSGGNCSGTMTSNGYNLSSDGTCNFNGSGDLNNTDPKLGQLRNYGGPTQTIPLLSGSPAIDAGNPSGCTDGNGHLLKTDQRGKPRPDKEDTGGCDMGAYERQSD